MPRGLSRSRGFNRSQAGIGTTPLLELSRPGGGGEFWNEEPFGKNGGYRGDSRITRWVFGDWAEACEVISGRPPQLSYF